MAANLSLLLPKLFVQKGTLQVLTYLNKRKPKKLMNDKPFL